MQGALSLFLTLARVPPTGAAPGGVLYYSGSDLASMSPGLEEAKVSEL